jgi:Holliday junction resolvase RusA-like endonuclease
MSSRLQLPQFDVAAMPVPADAVRFTIRGEAASKANSRELATIGPKDKRRTILRKSEKAIGFETSAILQIPASARRMFAGLVAVELRVFYASMRPDLDESIVLDVLQARFSPIAKGQPRRLARRGVYINDRQVWHKRVTRGLDTKNPRIEVAVWPISPEIATTLEEENDEPASTLAA